MVFLKGKKRAMRKRGLLLDSQKNSKNKSKKTYLYIYKEFEQVHSDTGISSKVSTVMKIVRQPYFCLNLPGELDKLAVSASTKVVRMHTTSK